MQHLLDFVQDHMVSDQLRVVLGSAAGELEITHQRSEPELWQLRATASCEPARRVRGSQLLDCLAALSVDMRAFQSELHALLATQITFAEVVLRDAVQLLGLPPTAAARDARRELLGILWMSLQELGPEPTRQRAEAANAEEPREPHLTLVT